MKPGEFVGKNGKTYRWTRFNRGVSLQAEALFNAGREYERRQG